MKTSVTITAANELLLSTARTAYTTYEQANNKCIDFVVPLALIVFALNVKPRLKKPSKENPVTAAMFRETYVVNGLGCSSAHYAKEITAIVTNGKIQALIDSKATISSLTTKCKKIHLLSLTNFNTYKRKVVGPKQQKSTIDLSEMSTGELTAHMVNKAANVESVDLLDAKIKVMTIELECLIARRNGLRIEDNPQSKAENVGNLDRTTKRTTKPKSVEQQIAA